jgi:hypothetical protein
MHNLKERLEFQQRKEWHDKFGKDIAPPVHLMSREEMKLIGLRASGHREVVTKYLEFEKMRKNGIDWIQEDLQKPVVHSRYQPLAKENKKVPSTNPMWIKKQKDLDKLFDDAGLFVDSPFDKTIASGIYVMKQRQRQKKMSINLLSSKIHKGPSI